jgi:hypothetical protein
MGGGIVLKSAKRIPSVDLIQHGQDYLKSMPQKGKGESWWSKLFGGGKNKDTERIKAESQKLVSEKKEKLGPIHKERMKLKRQLGRKDLKPDTRRDLEGDLKKIEKEYESMERKYDAQISDLFKKKATQVMANRVASRYCESSQRGLELGAVIPFATKLDPLGNGDDPPHAPTVKKFLNFVSKQKFRLRLKSGTFMAHVYKIRNEPRSNAISFGVIIPNFSGDQEEAILALKKSLEERGGFLDKARNMNYGWSLLLDYSGYGNKKIHVWWE